ncbi:hypothetical protein, partial [Actinocorallia lasiicapitis]
MSDARSVELPGDAELAYSGIWMGSLRGQRIFRELELSDVTDEQLEQVGAMHWLRVLRVRGPFSDTGLRSLDGLTGLAELALDSDRLTDAAPHALTGLPELRSLRLTSATATGAGLAALA